ncbi:MAG: chromosome segregation protein SMC [Ignavibacteriae bacterium]|nr:chromosome segregation protein SMC [Ignavibacteriota bacterium]
MYLSKLEILGFKSFANKTNIALNDGVTAIVGPNGCGKTNIVDALRWALGEQRYSTLRSDKMEDVIFNGSKSRKPIGVAEVSLTIQNNKGILPVEYNEVTITRRVFRSGESDYMLNRTVCRLKDIVSLFMDTGMGSNAYSVIELKMVETILSDKMEERRRLFEEAAGVTKYKSRRKEALRRLDEVEADLLRVDDIIAEVSKAVNSLNRQAKKAERYNQYIDRLRVLEIDVLQRDYTSLLLRLEPLEERLRTAVVERDASEVEVEREEVLLHEHRAGEREIEERLEQARHELGGYIARIGEYEQALAVNIEREKALLSSIERLTAAGETYTARQHESEAARNAAAERLGTAQTELGVLEQDYEEQRTAHVQREEIVSAKKLEMDSRRAAQMSTMQELSRTTAEYDRHGGRIESIDKNVHKLSLEDEQARKALAELREQLTHEDVKQSQILEAAIAAEREFHLMEERRQTIRGEIDVLQNQGFELQSVIGEKMTKIDFLSGLVDRLEGYSESVQHLLRNRDWSATTYGTIADAVNTRDDLRVAVEAALGDAAHYVLVNDFTEAISGLHNLKHHRKGKATFACLSRMPKTKAVPFPIAGDGVVGWAAELVSHRPEHDDLFQFLLRNCLLVRDAEVAHRCIREYPQLRCVTIDGDVFDSNGIVRGGSHGQEEGGLIGKKDQIARLTREVEQLKQRLAENQRLHEERNGEYSDIDLRLYADHMKQRQQDLSAHERRVAQMVFEAEKYERQIQKSGDERTALAAEREQAEEERAGLLPRIEELRTQLSDIERALEAESLALAELEQEYARSAESLNARNLARVQKIGEIQNLHSEQERLARTLTETLESLAATDREIEHARSATEGLVEERAQLERNIEQYGAERQRAEEMARVIESELVNKRNTAENIERLLTDERHKHTQSVTVVHETELRISEIRHRIETLEQRAREEYELTLQRQAYTEEDVFDLAQAREEINDLRMKVKALGLVNPLAYEEWTREKERFDLLTTQREDLVQSRQTLIDTIKEINQTAQDKFASTFEEIRKNFITIFKSLFDEGDEADLILGEGDDPLEARIDIIAKPRGKRPHSIDMLSGGEKTLTAIALLFGIYLVKPSPFCILDEVDAPLDDANIDRFIRILRKFSANTQFIVVTHNKRTMAAADTLYGVTMEEEGVSKIVAVDFAKDSMTRFMNN